MSGTRKLAAILAADVVGYSRLAGADEERTLARLRALRGDLLDPAIAAHRGRIVKRTGDGALVEFRSVVDAVRCALEVQTGMVERNEGVAEDRQIRFRIGIHLGDVVEEDDGDLMGDGVNIAARLESVAEPGGIALSALAYESVRDKIEASFADLGEKELKNIVRPVRVYAINPAPQESPSKPTSPSLSPQKSGEGISRPPRLSIVVLPFANMGSDPEQEYFVDGVTESLTTDLSRISGSFVIARNTAFTYKGKSIDVKAIGRELNVRYVLEGSVQRGGNRLRVNVQLIETGTGAHLWAERFDKPLADLFDMQDEIVARLANQLNAQLIAAEARRAAVARNPDSIDLWFRGRAIYQGSVQSARQARPLFEAALRLDERNVDALIGLADTTTLELVTFASVDRDHQIAVAEETIAKAMAIAPDSASVHYQRALLLRARRQSQEELRELERAIELNRNFAIAHASIGFTKIFLGRSEETEAHVMEALRLSPRDPSVTWFYYALGLAELFRGSLSRSAEWCRKAIEANPNIGHIYFYLGAALALEGNAAAATKACAQGLALQPEFTLRKYMSEALGDNSTYLAQRQRIRDGLRLAGVPEW